ncbi:unnamed protein product, partial [Discosporangium mesarthrocarpum]
MEAVSLLNGAVLSRLRRALRPITAVEKGVPVDAFVREVYRACLRDDARKGERGGWLQNPDKSHQLVESICHLFDLVDIDSLGVIKWEDFTDFCTDIGRRGAQEQQGRGRVPGEEDGGGLLDGIAGPNKFTVFVEKLGFVDRSSHCHEIGSLRFVKELQRLMVVEGGQQYLKVYVRGIKREVEIEPAITVQRTIIDEKGARYTRSKKQGRKGNTATVEGIPHRPHNVGRDNMAVLAAEFIGHVNQAVVSCADGNLSVWDLTTGKMLRYFPVRDVQVGLRYCPLMAVLISWGVDEYNNTILVWDIETFCTMHRLSGHTAAVRDVCEVFPSMGGESEDNGAKPSDNMLVTAGMDSKVIVWDLNLNSPERSRTPKQVSILLGHFHGVLSVAFSTEHDVIVTAGFDYEALCWDRSTRHLLQRLAGHRHSLIGVVIVRHETERAVTGDTGGNFRLWDIGGSRGSEQWGCLQTFSLSNPRAVRPRTMVVVWGEGLVVAGSKMHLFNAVRDVRPEETPAGAWFSTHTGQLCVLLGAVALFVDAATGDLATRMVLSGRSSSPGREITAVRLDACHKRIIVGEQGGGLQVYSGVNGRWVRSAHPHTAEVSDLLFVERDGTFVSVGWDRTIQIHDGRAHAAHVGGRGKGVAATATERQVSGLAGVWRSVRHAHNADITALAFSAPLGLLATSSHDLTVRVWDYALLRLEEVIVGHLHEVSCLCFLDPLPFLATADTAGKVMLWTTRPHPNAWSLVLQIRNTHLRLVEDLGIGRGSGGERADHSEDTGEGGGVGRGPGVGLAGARSEPFPRRKVTPVSVATLAFLYNPMAGSSRDDCRQGKVSGGADPVAGCLRGRERICKYSLITGDDLGTVKVWDVTALLESKLSIRQDDPHLPPFPLEREQRSVPEEGVEPGKEMRHSGRAVHQPIHHREQPLDGVRPQTAFRLRTLIDIAEFLRKRGHLPPDPRERGERGDWTGGGGSKDTNRITERVNTVAVPRGKAGEITPFGVRGGETEAIKEDSPGNTSSAGLRTKLNSAGSSTGAERRPKGSSLPHDRSCVSSTRLRDTPATIMAQVDSAPLATAVLNAPVDEMEPLASWEAHGDSITSLQVIEDPPSVLTGSLDHSVRLFSLDGNPLGVVIQNGRLGNAPWKFVPPVPGRARVAEQKANELDETLKRVRREERWQQAFPDPAPYSTHPRVRSWRENVGGDMGRCMPPPPSETSSRSFGSEQNGEAADKRLLEEIRGGENLDGNGTQPLRGIRDETAVCDGLGGLLGGAEAKKEQLREAWEAVSKTRYSCLGAEQERKRENRTRSTQSFLSEEISRVAGAQRPKTAARCGGRGGSTGEGKTPSGGRSGRSETSGHGRTLGSCASAPILVRCRPASSQPSDVRRRGSDGPTLTAVKDGGECPGREKTLTLTLTLRETRAPLLQRSTSKVSEMLSVPSARVTDRKESARPRTVSSGHRARIDRIIEDFRSIEGRSSGVSTTEPLLSPTRETPCHVGGGIGPVGWAGREGVQKNGMEGELRDGESEESSPKTPSKRLQGILTRFEQMVGDCREGDKSSGASGGAGDTPGRSSKGGNDLHHSPTQQAAHKGDQRYRRARRYSLGTMNENLQRKQEAVVGLGGLSAGRFGPYGLDDVLEFRGFAAHFDMKGGVELVSVRTLMESAEEQEDMYTAALLKDLSKASVLRQHQTMPVEELMQLVFHFAKHEELQRISNAISIMSLLERLWEA